jgi:predicted nucleic acid-binding Zn ribbon protein
MALRTNEKPTSRKSKAVSVGDAIKELLKFYQLEGKFNETFVVAHWEKIMGKTIASRTEKVYFKDKLMFVKVTSSPLKKDLMLSKHRIIDLINKEIGSNVVEDVVFL